VPGPPDLPGVLSAFERAGARYVVIGGFAVIANEYVRATEDTDLLIPDDSSNHELVVRALDDLGARVTRSGESVDAALIARRSHLRLDSDRGIVDLLKEGEPPLDFATVLAGSLEAEIRGVPTRFAGLASLVAFKRLANRVKDRQDLEALREIHGELPIQPVPGLDS
jgi:hypothetical protein